MSGETRFQRLLLISAVAIMASCSGGGGGGGSVGSTPPVAPSITAQPASITVTAGQTAMFSVTATGTAPLSYQWQENSADISGATSASYTTPATTTGDDG